MDTFGAPLAPRVPRGAQDQPHQPLVLPEAPRGLAWRGRTVHLVPTPGAGNCFLHAAADALGPGRPPFQQIRRAVADELANHVERYLGDGCAQLAPAEQAKRKEEVGELSDVIRRAGGYFEEPAVRAFCVVFGVTVVVLVVRTQVEPLEGGRGNRAVRTVFEDFVVGPDGSVRQYTDADMPLDGGAAVPRRVVVVNDVDNVHYSKLAFGAAPPPIAYTQTFGAIADAQRRPDDDWDAGDDFVSATGLGEAGTVSVAVLAAGTDLAELPTDGPAAAGHGTREDPPPDAWGREGEQPDAADEVPPPRAKRPALDRAQLPASWRAVWDGLDGNVVAQPAALASGGSGDPAGAGDAADPSDRAPQGAWPHSGRTWPAETAAPAADAAVAEPLVLLF